MFSVVFPRRCQALLLLIVSTTNSEIMFGVNYE
uniref:Uncharacterized protein n=1 Tax=Arundo donax TaxID=35708 RepID=A0A0A9HR10_ARUDO